MSIGLLGHMGLKQEAIFGEETAPPEVFARILSETIAMDNNLIRPALVTGSRFNTLTLPGRISAQGGIGLFLEPEGAVPWLLKGLFGEVSSEEIATGVYDHTFVPAQTSKLPSFNIQIDQDASAQNWLGCSFSRATISMAPDDLLSFDLDLHSQRPKEPAESATPVFSSVVPWQACDIVFTLNGVTNPDFESFRITFDNDIEPVWTLNGQRYCRKHVARGFEMQGVVTLEFETEEEMRRMWGSTSAIEPQKTIEPGSLRMTITHSGEIAEGYNYSLTVDVPEIYYSTAPANISAANRRILQTVAFVANYCASESKLVDLVLRNGEAGYPDPE